MIIYTAGTFDLPHYGHFKLLNLCDEMGFLTVVLNADEFIEEYKGSLPILSYEERAATLEEVGHHVIPNTYGKDCWKTIKQDAGTTDFYIVIGSDWAKKDYAAQMGVPEEELDEFHSRVIYVPYTEGISTTDIKERIWLRR